MVKDYSDGIEHQICGFISYINEELNEVHLGLGFYSKENKNLDVMTCKLIKTKMKDFMGILDRIILQWLRLDLQQNWNIVMIVILT